MTGVLDGYAIVMALVLLGFVLAHVGALGEEVQRALGRVVYLLATPALLLTLLAESDASGALGAGFVVAAVSAAAVIVLYAAVARWVWNRPLDHVVVGGLSASYINGGHLGLPIAVYVLGDATLVVPPLLMQLLLLAPLALAVLEAVASGRSARPMSILGYGARNPVTIAACAGLALSLAHLEMPNLAAEPISLIGQMAVPGALLAFGISLRLGPRPGTSGRAELACVAVLKEIVQPVIAFALAQYALGLVHDVVYGVTVMAALPTAQNVFIYASRFDRHTALARDSAVITTAASVPVILVISTLLR